MRLPCFHDTLLFASIFQPVLSVSFRLEFANALSVGVAQLPQESNGLSTSSANGGRQPGVTPLRRELVRITAPARAPARIEGLWQRCALNISS